MLPRLVVEEFDVWLATQGLRLEAVVVGGAALALLGVTDRQTRDVDILHPELSEEITEASRAFASHLASQGTVLGEDWLNNGPIQLTEVLPEGWQARLQSAFAGASLTLMTLGRADLLKTKLFALCDRGTDLKDCVALAPTAAELEAAEPWLSEQDANPMWPAHVRATLGDLSRRLNHDSGT